MRQTFEVPGRLPGLNDYVDACRSNPHTGARFKRETQELVEWAVKGARLKPMRPPVAVSFTWVEPNMKRDKDNISSAKKYILDALVACKVIGGDGWKWIAGSLPDRYMVNKQNPRVIVELEEVEKDADGR